MAADQKASTLAERLDKINEFERAPVTADKLQGGRYFAGLFAGEHVAATEFVIGALFVAWGVSARDLILGLLVGNALAVMSWVLICSPIATQTRLTLYWYVRRIIGPGLTVVYNFINAILYCCLAAAMIGVSASAVFVACGKLGLHLKHPTFNDVMPNSFGWVVVVGIVGAAVVVLAIAGFKKLSQFASICSPWMFTIFVLGAIVSLAAPRLGGVRSWDDLKSVAAETVWTGQPYQNPLKPVTEALLPEAGEDLAIGQELRDELAQETQPNLVLAMFKSTAINLSDEATITADPGQQRWEIRQPGEQGEPAQVTHVIKFVDDRDENKNPIKVLKVCSVLAKLGFWQIAFFAWFCNLAMHVGLSDMAVFRYAKHWSYGFYSAFGMYLGHYVAWVCAGIMGAAAGGGLNPGEMADNAAGFAGILAVLIAGWTTANPTIYRAGLALQIVTPNWPRWKVTLVAGAITTFVGCFPAIFMQLLDFVAIYGLVLMPIGAVIVVEHWLFPRIGLPRYWAEAKRSLVNIPALIAWITVLVICFPIEQFTGGAVQSPMALLGVHLFFRWLPGWFIAAIVYTILCYVTVAKRPAGEVEPPLPKAADGGGGGDIRSPHARPTPTLAWFTGCVALVALAVSLGLAIKVFLGGPEGYEDSLAGYKRGVLIATLVYFVGAIYYSTQREKAKASS